MEDDDLARLLSGRDEPSILEKEALFERIAAQTAAAPRQPRWLLWGGGVAAAAAGAALFLRLALPAAPELVARGSSASPNAASPEPSVIPTCVETGSHERCPGSGTLGFLVERAPLAEAYLALLSRTPDGGVIWYLPAAGERSVVLEPGLRSGTLLSSAAPLSGTHVPGRYEVLSVWSARPLTREALREQLGAELTGSPELRVVRHTFLVVAAP